MYDLKITNGLDVDGNGTEGIKTNIGIKDGMIVEVGECAENSTKTISAKDHIVTPGFIDLHTHYAARLAGMKN